MAETDVISVLNELIRVSKDGQKRFLEAERLVRAPDLKLVFQRFSDECANAAKDFEVCAVSAGGFPDNAGSSTKTLHGEMMNFRARLMPGEERTVLQECEGGEDRARNVYEAVMKAELPPAIRTVVEKQYAETLRHHRVIRALRDNYL